MLIIESNLGFEAAHNARYVGDAGIANIDVAHESSSRKQVTTAKVHGTVAEHGRTVTGVRTTNQSKEQMYIMLRSLLEEQTLKRWTSLLCASGNAPEQVQKIVRQMHNYTAVCSDPARVFSQARRVFTGKAMGEQDDLLIALQLAILYRRVYVKNCADEDRQR